MGRPPAADAEPLRRETREPSANHVSRPTVRMPPESLEGFYRQALGVRADGNQGEERVGARPDDGEVARGFVHDEKHRGLRPGVGRGKTHGRRRSADGDGRIGDAAIVDVDAEHARGGAVGDVHFGSIVGDDGACGSGAEEHVVADFVHPGVQGLKAVRLGRNYVEFAAIGLQEHLLGSAGEFEIRDQHGAPEIDDRKARLRLAGDEGQGRVRADGDFIGLRDYRDGVEELESARVVDGEGRGAAIDDRDVFGVRSEASLHRLGVRVRAAVNGAGGGVDGNELVGASRGGVDAIAGGRKIKRERTGANGDAGDLVRVRIQNENVAARRADPPDFVAFGMFAEIGDGRPNGNFCDRMQADKIDDGDGAVGGRGVSVHVQVGAQERRAMVLEDDDGPEDKEDREQRIDAEVLQGRHWVAGFYMSAGAGGNWRPRRKTFQESKSEKAKKFKSSKKKVFHSY